MTRTHLMASLFSLTALAGCASDDPDPVGVFILASEGGTVSLDGEETSLTIPPDALAADTMVTLSVSSLASYGPLTHGRERILVIEPLGLHLQQPATLLFDPGDPAIDPAAALSIAEWMEDTWIVPELGSGQLRSGGLVSMSLIRLAPIAVVERPPGVETASIRGTVKHIYTQEPLGGIELEVRLRTSVIATTTSADDGSFAFTGLPLGGYTVHALVTEEENCFGDATERPASLTSNGQEVDVAFAFVPGPCASLAPR